MAPDLARRGKANMKSNYNKGFTLIELMIVVAVLAIIVAIAYPGFLGQIQKARRSDAKQALFNVVAKMEQFYQDNKGYPVGSNVSDRNIVDLGIDDDVGDGQGSDGDYHSLEGYYAVSTTGATLRFTIQAIPIGTQVDDTDCGTFSIDHLGQKSVSGTMSADRCW